MGSLNSLEGALALSVVAMSIVFLVLGGLALLMVLIKYIARAIEKAIHPSVPVVEKGERIPPKVESAEEAREASLVEPARDLLESDLPFIAAAVASLSYGRPLRVWRVLPISKSLWRDSAKIESMIGGFENDQENL